MASCGCTGGTSWTGSPVGHRRLFDILPSRIEPEIIQMIDTPQATHIRYRVRR